MATMNRVYSLYKDSYESSLERLYERGLIFMPLCRRKATRNIVGVTEVHQKQVDQSEQIENMFSNPLTLYEASGLFFCRVGGAGTASALKTDIPQGRYVPVARVQHRPSRKARPLGSISVPLRSVLSGRPLDVQHPRLCVSLRQLSWQSI